MQEEIFQKIWALQGQLFEAQRDLIVWVEQFVPDEEKAVYNLKILRINHILEKIKDQEEKLHAMEKP